MRSLWDIWRYTDRQTNRQMEGPTDEGDYEGPCRLNPGSKMIPVLYDTSRWTRNSIEISRFTNKKLSILKNLWPNFIFLVQLHRLYFKIPIFLEYQGSFHTTIHLMPTSNISVDKSPPSFTPLFILTKPSMVIYIRDN